MWWIKLFWGFWNGLTAWVVLLVHVFGGWADSPLYNAARTGNWADGAARAGRPRVAFTIADDILEQSGIIANYEVSAVGVARHERLPAIFRRLALIVLITILSVAQASQSASAAASGFQSWWAKTLQPSHLWSGPDNAAVDFGIIPQTSYLLVVAPQQLTRFYVYVPWTQNYAYVDAASVVPSSAPPVSAPPTPTSGQQPSSTSATWTGRVVAKELLVRTGPSIRSNLLRTDPSGTIVKVVGWVAGDTVVPGDWTWAKLVDGTYAYSEALQIVSPTTPPLPPISHPTGRWIDINTLQQTVVAYDGDVPIHLVIASTGSPGWETTPGIHQILRRVADETMDSSTLFGLNPAHQAQANYHLTHVLYTQYFDDNAEGLHDNYWLPDYQFGVPHSHGCVGLRLADAAWFWNWATIGTSVVVH